MNGIKKLGRGHFIMSVIVDLRKRRVGEEICFLRLNIK